MKTLGVFASVLTVVAVLGAGVVFATAAEKGKTAAPATKKTAK